VLNKTKIFEYSTGRRYERLSHMWTREKFTLQHNALNPGFAKISGDGGPCRASTNDSNIES